MTKNDLYKVTGSILMNYIANHYNEEIKHLPIYKHKLKNTVNNAIKELTKAEIELYDKVYEIDEDEIGNKLSVNLITFVDAMITKLNFPEFCKVQEIVMAYVVDPESISEVSNTILEKFNEAKSKKVKQNQN